MIAEAEMPRGHLLAEFTTRFKARYATRAANVRLATHRLHGVVLRPYERMSYNDVVGPRSAQAGFLPAPAIDRGREVDALGGGVCQPSSTLHAAALLAGLEIVERRPHTWLSKYIAPGFDATVVYGIKDLVVRNPYPFSVRLDVEADRSHVTVRLLGERAPAGWVSMDVVKQKQLEFDTEVDIDSNLEATDMLIMRTGIPGGKYTRKRTFHAGRKGTRKERLSLDTYYPRSALVRIGPDSPEPIPTSVAP